MEDVLRIANLNKSYFGNPALSDINLSIKAGEIHGMVGANGSGKTTLMNILFGNPIIHSTGGYQGRIFFQGKKVTIKSCGAAIKMGIGMIHQEFALIPALTVAENIKLGRETTHPLTDRLLGRQYSFIDHKQNNKNAMQTLRKLGLNLDPGLKIMDLSINMKQFVEIAREIDRQDLKLLILDEPTAVLNQHDSLKLIEILRELSAQGIGIIFISHRLEEVQHICDRVTVLRDGKVVSQYEKGGFTIGNLAQDMIGHTVNKASAAKRTVSSRPIITFKDFRVGMPGEEISGLDLSVCQGEILGLTSLSGHGKLALGYGMMGVYPVNGEVYYQNKRLDSVDAQANIVNGMYVLPDDRQRLGILSDQSVENNIVFTGNQIKNMFRRKLLFSSWDFIDHKATSSHVNQMISDFDIKCTSPRQKASELSGGNQQKVCLARALTVDPDLLFVAEPTRGVDIAAKEKILNMLIDLNRSKGTTIIMASSELDELTRVCDRIAVLVEGRVFKIMSPDAPDMDFGLALSGAEGVAYAGL